MLLWIGAVVSGFLGYKTYGWWVPTAVAFAAVAGQAIGFRSLLERQSGGLELLALSLLINLLMFHATFSIGRTIRQRFSRRKRGAS